MTLEDYRDAWQGHDGREVAAPGEDALLEWVRDRSEAFEKKIRRRDLLETAAAALAVALFGYEALTSPSIVAKVGAGIVVASAVFIAWRLRRARRALGAEDAGRPVADRLRIQRRKVDAQIELLESVVWWYVSPVALGASVFAFGVSGASWGTLLTLAVVVGVSVAVWWLNRRAVRRDLRPRREELTRRLRRLQEPRRDGPDRPRSGRGPGSQ